MKRHNIDGLPGITMHGKKGPDGPRGGMTFCNSEASVTIENITMDVDYTYSLGVVYSGKEHKILPCIKCYIILYRVIHNQRRVNCAL